MYSPRLIALCGNPGAGKSTAAALLVELYPEYQIADDGLPLREIAMKYLGLGWKQVFTQSGKLEEIELNGRRWSCREILGEIGNAFEEKFGGDIIPIMSLSIQKPRCSYIMASVRRDQGFFWKKQGALVVEIVNPTALPSPYPFDQFNRSAVRVALLNDGLARGLSADEARADLAAKLKTMLYDLPDFQTAEWAA